MRPLLILLSFALATSASVVSIDAFAKSPADDRFYFRVGPLLVSPQSKSGNVILSEVDGTAGLAIENGPLEGTGAVVHSTLVPVTGVIGVTLPWLQRKLSAELVLGLPTKISFSANDKLATEPIAAYAMGIPTGVPALGRELGSAKALVIVVTGVYRFQNSSRFIPFAGAGLAHMTTQDPKLTNPILIAVNQPTFTVERDIGYIAQAGLDVRLFRNVYLGLDIKFIADLVARGKVKNIHVNTPGLPLYETAKVGNASANVTINPILVQLGIGARF